ncbi:MAG: DUF4124 domain-containing protein [Gammaproteobacteria bacterium]
MKKLTLIFLLMMLSPFIVLAEIYKSVDSEGNVVYSDEPGVNTEAMPEPSPNTVQMPKPTADTAAPKAADDSGTEYTRLRIVSPSPQETIRSNPGILNIVLALKPKLDTKAGHTVSILVDGQVLVSKSSLTRFQIPDINRGTHRVQAVVSDKEGRTLIKTDNVQFFMQRQSVLNKTSSVGPVDATGKPITPGPQGTYYAPGPVITPPAPITNP